MMRATKLGITFLTVLKIRPGEGLRVGLMFVYSLAAIGGVFIIGRAVGRALFLSTLSRDQIPYKFILPPLVIVLVVALYTRFSGRFRLDQVTIATNMLMVAALLLFRLLLGTQYGTSFGVLAALFVVLELIATLIGIQLWTFAGEVFDQREAKRLFGLIAGGGTVANVFAGGLLTALSSAVAPANLIFGVIGAITLCIICARMLGRTPQLIAAGGKPRLAAPASSDSFLQSIGDLRCSPLLLSMSGLMLTMSLVTNITEYQLDLALQAAYGGDGQRMVGFLGSFALYSGLIACLLQFFATNRVLERFGIFFALLVLPFGIALGSSLVLLTGGALLAVVLPRAADMVFRYTINDTSLNLLFLPVPGDLRRRTKALLEGVAKPPVIGALGLLFLVLANVQRLTVVHWVVPVVGLVVLWIVLVLRIRKQYIVALTDTMQKRRINLDTETLDIADETTVEILASRLKHPDDLQVLHALHLISSMPAVDWAPRVAPLIDHSSPEVIVAAVDYLTRSGKGQCGGAITALFGHPHEEVRAAAIVALCAQNGHDATPDVTPFLGHGSARVQGAAIVGLIKYGGLDGILHAAEHLKRMLESEQAHMRAQGAYVLGAIGVRNFYHPLLGLFDDENREVQLRAIRAAGELCAHELVPHLIRKLGNPATAPAAAQALVRYGSAVEPTLTAVLADDKEPRTVREQVPKIFQQIGTPRAATSLSAQLTEPDEAVRTSIYRSLAGLSRSTELDTSGSDSIYAALQGELRSVYTLAVIRADLDLATDDVLLQDALADRMSRAFRRIFFLLDILYPGQSLELVHRTLQGEQNARRSAAVELLDNLLEHEIKELLVPLLDAPDEQVVELAHSRLEIPAMSRTERLDQLASGADLWLRSCAIACIGASRLIGLTETVRAALAADDDVVRETAAIALHRLDDALPGHAPIEADAAVVDS